MGANAQQPQQFSQAAPAQGKQSSAPQYNRTATDGSQVAHGNSTYTGGPIGIIQPNQPMTMEAPVNTVGPMTYSPDGTVGHNPVGSIGGNPNFDESATPLQTTATGSGTIQGAQANALRQPSWQRRATQNPQEEATEAAPAAPTNPAGLNQPQSTPATPDTQPGGMQGKVSQLPPQYQQGIQQLMSGMQGKQSRQPPLQFQQRPQTRRAQQPAQSDTAQALRGGSAAPGPNMMDEAGYYKGGSSGNRYQAPPRTAQDGAWADDAGGSSRKMADGSYQVKVAGPMGEQLMTLTPEQFAKRNRRLGAG